jgi:hypothetical protein
LRAIYHERSGSLCERRQRPISTETSAPFFAGASSQPLDNPDQKSRGLPIDKSICRRFRGIRFIVAMKMRTTTLYIRKENFMTNDNLLLSDVARLLRVKPYRVTYALTTGLVPEPQTRIANKRIFDADDVARLADYFGTKTGTAADAETGMDQATVAQNNTE